MKIKLIYLVVLSQLFLIFFLGYRIYQKKSNILGSTTVNIIPKKAVNIKPSRGLKYFFEPKAETEYNIDNYAHYINKDSLREDYNYPINKSIGSYRIIALGDSFTFGLFVESDNTWPKKLEYILKHNCTKHNYQVINFGVESYDIEYTIERYRKRGVKYKADLIVWLHTDFLRILEKLHPFLEKYKDYSNSNNLYYGWNLAFKEYRSTYSENELINYQKRLLGDFVEKVRISTAMFILSNQDDQTKYLDIYKELSDLNPLIFNTYIKYNDNMRIPGDGHPSEYGHQVIAQDVYNYLIKNKLVPCN